MPDLDPIKQGEQGVRDRRGQFTRGRSRNPAGRPRGCRDHVNRAARLLLAGEGVALTRKAVAPALPGDRRHYGCASKRIVGPIVNARSNSRCRQSATPSIWGGQRVKADPTEAGKIRTLRWSRESDAQS